jgi:hypothetical protein
MTKRDFTSEEYETALKRTRMTYDTIIRGKQKRGLI